MQHTIIENLVKLDSLSTMLPNDRKMSKKMLRNMQTALAIFSLRPKVEGAYSEADCERVAAKFQAHERYVRRLWNCSDVAAVARVAKNNRLRRRNFTIEIFHQEERGYYIPFYEVVYELGRVDPFERDWSLSKNACVRHS